MRLGIRIQRTPIGPNRRGTIVRGNAWAERRTAVAFALLRGEGGRASGLSALVLAVIDELLVLHDHQPLPLMAGEGSIVNIQSSRRGSGVFHGRTDKQTFVRKRLLPQYSGGLGGVSLPISTPRRATAVTARGAGGGGGESLPAVHYLRGLGAPGRGCGGLDGPGLAARGGGVRRRSLWLPRQPIQMLALQRGHSLLGGDTGAMGGGATARAAGIAAGRSHVGLMGEKRSGHVGRAVS